MSLNPAEFQNKSPASIMMIIGIASNWEKMTTFCFERSYRLTSAVYKEVFKTKVPSWVKKRTQKSDWLDANMNF